MCEWCSSRNNLNTLQFVKIKRCENRKQGIKVKSTPNQSIHSHKSSMTCQIASEMFKIPDLSKTGLAVILDMPQKEKKSQWTDTPRSLITSAGERELKRILTQKYLLRF